MRVSGEEAVGKRTLHFWIRVQLPAATLGLTALPARQGPTSERRGSQRWPQNTALPRLFPHSTLTPQQLLTAPGHQASPPLLTSGVTGPGGGVVGEVLG